METVFYITSRRITASADLPHRWGRAQVDELGAWLEAYGIDPGTTAWVEVDVVDEPLVRFGLYCLDGIEHERVTDLASGMVGLAVHPDYRPTVDFVEKRLTIPLPFWWQPQGVTL